MTSRSQGSFANFTSSLLPAYVEQNDILSQNATQAVLLSPISVLLSMIVAMLGAQGDSKNQIQRVIWDKEYSETGDLLPVHESSLTLATYSAVDAAFLEEHFTFHLALYLQTGYEMNPEFTKPLSELFREHRPRFSFVDFSRGSAEDIAAQINSDLQKSTDGLFENIASKEDIESSSRMLMVNAAFFSDPWKVPFNTLLTMRNSPFYLMKDDSAATGGNGRSNSDRVLVDMMQIKSEKVYDYAENIADVKNTQSVRLFYKNGASILLILPASNSRDDIEELLYRMRKGEAGDKSFISQLLKSHKKTPLRFIQIPRTIIEFQDNNLQPTLESLGIRDVFDSNKADFSNMVKNPNLAEGDNLAISKLMQKTLLPLLDERVEGEVGAGDGGFSSAARTRVTFNRPFVALLIGKDDNLLMSSLVLNPTIRNE